jgi:hypothetical protein
MCGTAHGVDTVLELVTSDVGGVILETDAPDGCDRLKSQRQLRHPSKPPPNLRSTF